LRSFNDQPWGKPFEVVAGVVAAFALVQVRELAKRQQTEKCFLTRTNLPPTVAPRLP
jgi:hypothetical protein